MINSYTTGLQPAVLRYMLDTLITPRFGGEVSAEEIGLRVTNASAPEGKSVNMFLPCGASGRWSAKK